MILLTKMSKAHTPGIERELPCLVMKITGLDWDFNECYKEKKMLGTILLIVVILMLIGAIPAWPHSRGWGYGPSGGLGLILIILIILLLLGRI